MTHAYVRHIHRCTMMNESCHMTHSHVTWLIHTWHDSVICDMTYSHVTWLMHICDITCAMAHSYVWHDSFTRDVTHACVSWLIHTRYDSFVCVTWQLHIHKIRHGWSWRHDVEKLPEIVRQQIPEGAGVFESCPHINGSWHIFHIIIPEQFLCHRRKVARNSATVDPWRRWCVWV